MSLSNFHLLKNTLIEAMKIERDDIPPVEKSIEDSNQLLQELQMKLDKAESNLSKWESKEPWSTRKINARNRKASKLSDQMGPPPVALTVAPRIVGLALLFLVLFAAVTPVSFWPRVLADLLLKLLDWAPYLDGIMIGLLLLFLSALFMSYAGFVIDESTIEHKRTETEARTIRKELKENSDEFISKKRNTAKGSVTKAKNKLDACEKELIKLEWKAGNLRYKEEELMESVSHLIPYSENLS